jgi:HD-GYP domain-containing protein (c-di-GMP phosphodiesterase class II)
MEKYKINDIPENTYFRGVVYLDDEFIIASPEIPIDEHLKKLLLGWEFREIASEGELTNEPPEELLPFFEKPEESVSVQDADDEDRVIRATEIYTRLTEFTGKLLNRVSSQFGGGQANEKPLPGKAGAGPGIDYRELAAKAREFCRIIQRENRYLLRVMQYKHKVHGKADSRGRDPSPSSLPREDYQVSHTVNSLILAVTMGDYLKLSDEKLIDLAVAALLHETGMLHIPPETYLTDKPLTREEHRAILSHPILGFNILKSLNFPQNIRLAVLEHHERENGSGYPQKLTGSKISLYAKIIAVACSFEAITSTRPYKDARDGHSGILDLLKNEGGRYDEAILRALIYSLSIYPIGSYVLLSDGREAQVVDVDPDEPRYPIVRIYGQSGEAPIKTSPIGLRILRSLPQKEGPEK